MKNALMSPDTNQHESNEIMSFVEFWLSRLTGESLSTAGQGVQNLEFR